MPVRGHRLPLDPLAATAEEVAADLRLRHRREEQKRFLRDSDRAVIEGVVHSVCAKRGIACLGLGVGPTCLTVVLRADRWLRWHRVHEPIRTIVGRKLRRSHGWARSESVFTTRARNWILSDAEVGWAVEAAEACKGW